MTLPAGRARGLIAGLDLVAKVSDASRLRRADKKKPNPRRHTGTVCKSHVRVFLRTFYDSILHGELQTPCAGTSP